MKKIRVEFVDVLILRPVKTNLLGSLNSPGSALLLFASNESKLKDKSSHTRGTVSEDWTTFISLFESRIHGLEVLDSIGSFWGRTIDWNEFEDKSSRFNGLSLSFGGVVTVLIREFVIINWTSSWISRKTIRWENNIRDFKIIKKLKKKKNLTEQ